MTSLASQEPPAHLLEAGETADAALAGTVRVIQPRRGYRFGVDSVLLARFAAERRASRAVDLGCGSGVVGMCLLALRGAREVLGIDIQGEMIDRARRAARWNGVEGQTRFETMDLRDAVPCSLADGFDLAVTNPPYRSARSGRVSALSSAALSRHEIAGGLSDVVAAARQMLRPQGHLCVIYPASRLASLVTAVCREGIEPKVLRLVHPRSAEPASLALLRAVRGAKEGLEIRPPLFLHGHGDRYSPEAGALLGHP